MIMILTAGPQTNSLWAAEGAFCHCGHPPGLVLGVKRQDRHLGYTFTVKAVALGTAFFALY